MSSANILGVHLLPSTGEFTYDTVPHLGAVHNFTTGALGSYEPMNTFFAGGGSKTDYSYAIDQLQAQHPECGTVGVVIAWFFNSTDASSCQIYPSTNFIQGAFEALVAGVWVADSWRVSSLTQTSSGLLPLPLLPAGGNVYGGTPSDQSVVRCIQDLKARGFKVIFYPFLLSTAPGYPWRGRITCATDLSSATTAAVAAFMGAAAPADFAPDPILQTVAYSGSPLDYSYRRMILHYAWLCTVAGGVNLFVIGSEMRGLEILRGPTWTKTGATDGSGSAIWDYPFVAALQTLADDVRSVFDGQGYTKNLAGLENLVVYSADWSSWMGWQHAGEDGQWPHLDQLWAHANIDFVSFDNYLPLSDWTTGSGGGLDGQEWLSPAPSGAWPPSSATMSGLGLSGPPSIYSPAYLKGNIEGGEKFNWYYNDGTNDGRGLDPNGSDLNVSLPEGDRLAQTRSPYFSNQQILANKQLRWWWNNPHYAVYDTGAGWAPQGPATEWAPNSKSILFLEYGVPAVDKGTNQPNVFFDPKSVESFTPYWSIWTPAAGGGFTPLRDDTIQALALEAIYEYWNVDGANETSSAGVVMVQFQFSCVWNWDARPFPVFPLLNAQWGDAENWIVGDWVNGLRATLPPPAPTPPPSPGTFQTFPAIATLGWSTHIKPKFATLIARHVSGRETRGQRYANPYFDIELTYELLRSSAPFLELQTICGFFELMSGRDEPFWIAPPGLSAVVGQAIGTGDGSTTTFSLMASIGGYVGPVYGASGVSAVYLNGVSQASGWSVTTGYAPAIVFSMAPSAGIAITADFGMLWLCRFAEDVQDFEEFMTQLFELRTLRLTTVRP